jgi:hypothetical protein
VVANPASLFSDPDFLQYNPEFSLLQTASYVDAGTMVVEEGSSDAATALWQWVLADPAARQWLSGVPDPWGMRVNPYYSINALDNPDQTAFGTPTPETFPKSDPYCDNTHAVVGIGKSAAPARPLCMQDWSPYTQSMAAAALAAATANDGAKTTLNTLATPDTAWTANGPQLPGQDMIISITTSTAAQQYGLPVASLSQDGDDGSNPTFIAPTDASILAGEAAMPSSAVPGVLAPDPSTTAPGAYPLSLLTYGVTNPSQLTAASKQGYAALLRYAAGAGQVVGPEPGQLPAGYVPLPTSLKNETLTAATTILNATTAPTAPTTPTPAPTAPSTPAAPLSTGSLGDTGPLALGSTGPSTPVAATKDPVRHAAAASTTQLAAVRSPVVPVGAVRWALPVLLLVGVGAGVAALMMGNVTRGPRPAPTMDEGGADGPDPGDPREHE